jgi:hypothetical protein
MPGRSPSVCCRPILADVCNICKAGQSGSNGLGINGYYLNEPGCEMKTILFDIGANRNGRNERPFLFAVQARESGQ